MAGHGGTDGPARVVETLTKRRVLAVTVVDEAASAGPLGEALAASGLQHAEITFRTVAAAAAIKLMAQQPELVVGAGTVLTCTQVDEAVTAGARFIVTPGFSAAVVGHCQELGVEVFPGVATATEVMMALDTGLDVVKFFPAEQSGGLGTLSALRGPFPALRFIPTGGITSENLPSYLDHPAVLAVGGSWMVAPSLIRGGRWTEIGDLSREAVLTAAAR